MDGESKKLLEETYALAKDNNKMLHAIRRGQKWASFMRLMYWLIIIGISIGIFYYLEPYITKLESLVSSSIEGINNLNKASNSVNNSTDQLKNINIDQLKNLLNKQR